MEKERSTCGYAGLFHLSVHHKKIPICLKSMNKWTQSWFIDREERERTEIKKKVSTKERGHA